MITPHTLASESITDELSMLLVGEPKAGKSWLEATAPGNIFYFDFDRRLASLKMHWNAKNLYGLTFADPSDTKTVPTAMNELLDILTRLEKSPLLRDLHESFAACGDKWVDTLVFDSIQTIADSARRYVLFNGETGTGGITRLFQIGGRQYRVAKSYHAWGGEMEMVTGAILQARALLHCRKCAKSVTYEADKQMPGSALAPGVTASANGVQRLRHTDKSLDAQHPPEPKAMNVLCSLHECMEEDERSTEEVPMYTGKIEVYPRRYNSLLSYFNEVWRVIRDSGRVPRVQVDPDGKFTKAATALGITSVTSGVNGPSIQEVLNNAKSLRK